MRALSIVLFTILSFSLVAESILSLDSTSSQATAYKTMGIYSDVTPFVAGITQQFNFDQGESEQLRLTATLGGTYNPVNDTRYDQLYDVTATVGVGWVFNLQSGLTVTPQLGAGIIVHTLYGDMDIYESAGYSFFADQYYRFAVQVALDLKSKSGENNWSLLLSPECAIFPEQDNLGILVGTSLGIQRNL